jgi:uncharacterized membrane protein YeaQ/YmgE (transglycosylase-associated protein family)
VPLLTLAQTPWSRKESTGASPGIPLDSGKETNRKDYCLMLGMIIAAIVIGIIAGYLGRLLLPGPDPMGFVGTVIAGIIGSLVGFFLFTSVLGIGDNDKFDLGGIVGAVIGTMIVLALYRMVAGGDRTGRTTTGRTV